MIEHEQTITETEWIMYVVINEGVIIDDSNYIPRVEYIIKKCKESKKNRILVDTSAADRKVSVLKLYEGIKMLPKMDIGGFKIALVTPKFVHHEDSRFVENVAFNNGLFIKYFPDKDTALEWLLK